MFKHKLYLVGGGNFENVFFPRSLYNGNFFSWKGQMYKVIDSTPNRDDSTHVLAEKAEYAPIAREIYVGIQYTEIDGIYEEEDW